MHLVSFSVDPDKDKPEVLRGYAEKLNAQPGRWDFFRNLTSSIGRWSCYVAGWVSPTDMSIASRKTIRELEFDQILEQVSALAASEPGRKFVLALEPPGIPFSLILAEQRYLRAWLTLELTSDCFHPSPP